MIIGIITIFGLTILADCNLNLNSSTTNNYSNTSIINEQSISNATNPIKVGTIGNETINLNITGFAANISQITNDTTSATTINEQQPIMRISLMSNGTNPENESQNKTDLTENISQITTTLPTEESSTTTSTTINDQEQIIISVISNSTNHIKVENRTSENEALNLNITANTSQIINDTTMASENNSTTSPTTINGQERISLISPENETLNLNKTDLAANKSQIIEEETTLATEDSTTSSTIINDQEQIMRISLISNVTANTSQITTTTEEETTTTTSEDSSSTSQSNSDNEDSSEEEDDEEELDDDESPPGFGNNTDFAATLTSTSTAPINLTDDTILYANSSESSSVPVIDWRSKFDNTTTDDKKQTALLRRKNLKVLLEYLKSKDINRLVVDIEMSERYRKVAAALKNTIGLLQTLSIDNKDDK